MRRWDLAVACVGIGLVGLSGCTSGVSGPKSSIGSAHTGIALAGKVRGGQQPISGAHVYLLAANTTGYGGNGIAGSPTNASVSLLARGTLDTSGGATDGDYYVTTDVNGDWTISGDYSCTAGQQVYLYSAGGDPGAGANSGAALVAALGTCPAAGNFASATPYVVINEVSTVAMAYAIAGFATDATHVSSSGTALAQTAIANAFSNAANSGDAEHRSSAGNDAGRQRGSAAE